MKRIKQRKKAYRPRPVNVPVTAGLQREFMFGGHGALAAMRLAPSESAFDQLAALFNLFYVALTQKGVKSVILESGMRALMDVAKRHDDHGVWEIRRFELPPIELAVFECERLCSQFDVMGLYASMLKTRALERLSMAHAPLEAA